VHEGIDFAHNDYWLYQLRINARMQNSPVQVEMNVSPSGDMVRTHAFNKLTQRAMSRLNFSYCNSRWRPPSGARYQ
jgi:uncharacterized protein YraI